MRAVTYIRVSTEEEKQLNAFAKQREEAIQSVRQNGWDFVKEYLDEGKTGTTTSKRDGYNALFKDLEYDLFDVIVIKSQDRLMRNVKDWYIFISKMIENKKKLYMYMDNRFYQSDDSLITGIKAILAEEYSRDLSKKLLNANAHRIQSGKTIISNGSIWGYDQINGELVINEQEAVVVRRVFEMYAAGYGTRRIKSLLDADGILSKRGTKIGISTIKRMVCNPLYVGDVAMHKIHYDFDTKRKYTVPKNEWVIHKDRVQPIISRELFEKTCSIKESRTTPTRLGIRKGTHFLSGKIKCGICGTNYRRTSYNTSKGKIVYWVCGKYQEYGRQHSRDGKTYRENGCDCRIIREDRIFSVISSLIEDFDIDFDKSFDDVIKALNEVFSSKKFDINYDDKIEAINRKKSFLLDKLIDGVVSQEDYTAKMTRLSAEIESVEEQKRQSLFYRQDKEECLQKILGKKEELRRSSTLQFITDHIEKIIVNQDDIEIDVDLFGKVLYPLCSMESISEHIGKKYICKC